MPIVLALAAFLAGCATASGVSESTQITNGRLNVDVDRPCDNNEHAQRIVDSLVKTSCPDSFQLTSGTNKVKCNWVNRVVARFSGVCR